MRSFVNARLFVARFLYPKNASCKACAFPVSERTPTCEREEQIVDIVQLLVAARSDILTQC